MNRAFSWVNVLENGFSNDLRDGRIPVVYLDPKGHLEKGQYSRKPQFWVDPKIKYRDFESPKETPFKSCPKA